MLGGIVFSSSSIISSCQDCGNKAKKDCEHLRCRTCCLTRGFNCPTHIKSTWIPRAGRRPRQRTMQHQIAAPTHVQQQEIRRNPKRYRSENIPASLGLQEGDFPGEVTFPAVFRCVRVSSMDNVVDQYAYQTSVSIGGNVFTGILYQQGPNDQLEETGNYVTGETLGSLQQPNFVNGTTYPGSSVAFTPTTCSQLCQYPKY